MEDITEFEKKVTKQNQKFLLINIFFIFITLSLCQKRRRKLHLSFSFFIDNIKKQNFNSKEQAKMIFEKTPEELNAWKNEMRDYEKGKRTKKPFGKSVPHTTHVTHEQIKARQNVFNPVLQTFSNKDDEKRADSILQANRIKSLMTHIKNVEKYEKNYDIINLYESQGPKTQTKAFNKKLGPIRNAYNIINNQKLPDYYFKNRDIRIPQQRKMNLIDYHKKEFDIITGNYKENNEEKIKQERQFENEEIMKKYWRTHNYDPVYGKFYDFDQEEHYQQMLKEQEKQHGKDNDKKYPPSYVYREPLILDFDKPLPETLKELDEKEQLKKRKYQLKYIIQDEYGQRNVEQEDKHEHVVKNRVHDGRLLDEKSKHFDIITNKNYPENRVEKLYGKTPKLNSWQEYIKPTDNLPTKFIKTSGFN